MRCEQTVGAVAEWLKATVLKTVGPKGPGGSNPSCSVQCPVLVTSVGTTLHPFHVLLEDLGCILVPAQGTPLTLGV